jgi:serine/threonine protein kinase
LLQVPKAGDIFEERYELLRVLGAGAMGYVFEARQLDCDRYVALKVCTVEIAGDEELKARFLQEARALSLLNQANIVTVYHLSVSESGMPFLVMELVRGESLRSILETEKRLPASRAIRIMQQACDALAYAHSKDIVHRDLKPENMILLQTPEPDYLKIIDFGLARVVYGSSGQQVQKLTQTGMLVGSVNYMSPEQCLGRAADQRCDIYSLSACFYEMLTGRAPYSAESPTGILYKHVSDPVPRLIARDLITYHPSLQEFLDRGMSKKLETRFQSMTEMKAELDRVGEKLSGAPSGVRVPFALPKGLSFIAASTGILLALVLLIAAITGRLPHSDTGTVVLMQSRTHKRQLSPRMRLKSIKDKLDNNKLDKRNNPAVVRPMLEELEEIIASKGVSKELLFVACVYKHQLQELLGLPVGDQEKTLEKCLTYGKTTDGRDTREAGQIYYWLASHYLLEGRLEAADSAARKSYDLRKAVEAGDSKLPTLNIPAMLDLSQITQTSSGVSTLLGNIAEAAGHNEEALKWFDLALSTTNADFCTFWEHVCRKAGVLLKLGRKADAIALLKVHADLLYETGIQSNGAQITRTISGFIVTENSVEVLGKLGDWAAERGELSFARRAYQQQCQLIDKTGASRNLKKEALHKLAEIEKRLKKIR